MVARSKTRKLTGIPAAALVLALAACGGNGNPLFGYDTTTGTNTPSSGVTGSGLPPGTASPSAGGGIVRVEADSEARVVSYDFGTDTIKIDNLPFDGDGIYDRGSNVSSLGSYAVYENPQTNESHAYKAVYGVSPSGNARFAIVGTGDYTGYGYGGFVYQRDVPVDIPTSGQATYTGDYGGIRVYKGENTTDGDLRFVTGHVSMIADFTDFKTGDAVEASIDGREERDTSGARIKDLPSVKFSTQSITDAGELTGLVATTAQTPDIPQGADGTGTFYAILSGSGADEVVGVMVMDGKADHLASQNVEFEEKGGFVLLKQ